MRIIPPASSVTAVSPGLFLGSLADAERLAKDNPRPIRTVITLCEECVKQRATGIRYLQFPVCDAHPIPIALLNAILEAIYKAVADGATLVHCHSGVSRTPTLLAAFLDHGFDEIRGCDLLSGEVAAGDRAIPESDSERDEWDCVWRLTSPGDTRHEANLKNLSNQ